jgi:hypothetical protein
MELQQGLRAYRTAAVVSCIGQRSIVKLPILRIEDSPESCERKLQ